MPTRHCDQHIARQEYIPGILLDKTARIHDVYFGEFPPKCVAQPRWECSFLSRFLQNNVIIISNANRPSALSDLDGVDCHRNDFSYPLVDIDIGSLQGAQRRSPSAPS